MARHRHAPKPRTDDPLLHEAKRLLGEATRLAAAPPPDDPNHKVRLAALISELGEVHGAMVEERDAIRRQTDTVVRQNTALSAYARTAMTLTNGRKRP
jgi:hypothetical protein